MTRLVDSVLTFLPGLDSRSSIKSDFDFILLSPGTLYSRIRLVCWEIFIRFLTISAYRSYLFVKTDLTSSDLITFIYTRI